MPLVLDASVALVWHFEDESSEYADRVLARLGEDGAVAPALWPLEVANGLLAAQRRGRITEAGVAAAVQQTLDMGVLLFEVSPAMALSALLELARSEGLTIYDAAYLHLAMREGIHLATLDDDLIAAAKRVGVAVIG
jgi:predicted nucleic acid-binding protein